MRRWRPSAVNSHAISGQQRTPARPGRHLAWPGAALLRDLFLAALLTASACTSRPPITQSPVVVSDSAVRLTIVQLNDIYEITPLAGGRWGGPARVATLLHRLEQRNPATIAILAGDFLSPSALGTAIVDGERLDGRQMVDVLNTMGLDYATIGNHEFDLREAAFLARLEESEFRWISSNVTGAGGQPLPGIASHVIVDVGDEAARLRVGLIGITMTGYDPAYARVADPAAAAAASANLLADSVDVLVAITHLPFAQDIALAEATPAIDLILGGHEHENLMIRRGNDLTPITKADANARSVWIHDLAWRPDSRSLTIDSHLVPIIDTIPDHAATAAVSDRWVAAAYQAFRAAGFEPTEVVGNVTVELDGLESVVRNRSTTLTQLIVDAMRAEVVGADAAFVNAGSIRIDDVLPAGPLTQYDVIRILPFGGPVVEVQMTGTLLLQTLDQGLRNRGGGGFLQLSGIDRADERWHIAGAPVEPDRRYRIALSDFLLTGREQGLAFLSRDNPDLVIVREHRDVRLAFIAEVRRRWP
ncbi:MAG: bifunctional metallophosphatase/5'-nucleotidase [Longimicrobiales bacterium]